MKNFCIVLLLLFAFLTTKINANDFTDIIDQSIQETDKTWIKQNSLPEKPVEIGKAEPYTKINPSIAKNNVNLGIHIGNNNDLNLRGFPPVVQHISGEAIGAFGLNRDAAGRFMGRVPNDMIFKDPTRWGNIFQRYNWAETRTAMHAVSGRILRSGARSVTVSQFTLTNDSGSHTKQTATLSNGRKNTITTSFSSSATLGMKVGVEVNFVFGKASIETSFSATFGQSRTHSFETSVGSSVSVEVDMPPRSKKLVKLYCMEYDVDLQIDYRVTLQGRVFLNYHPTHRGHHFWGVTASAISGKSYIPNTQRMRTGFFAHYRTEVTDL